MSGDGLTVGASACGGAITAMPAAPETPVDCATATSGSIAATTNAASTIGARHRRRNRIASAGVVWIAPNTRQKVVCDGLENQKEHMPAEKPGV